MSRAHRPPRRDGRRAARIELRRARRDTLLEAHRLIVPESLPIAARADELIDLITQHQVVIVAGETGSGKSTQLPKLCLAAGRGVEGLIGHTQSRRVAARTIAERVAEELGSAVGEAVGYAVRFTDRVGDDSLIKVMTDGILLAEIQRDRNLSRYDTIIIDEAHERSLNIDFLLGYLKQLLPRRRDLKVIVTSATIDTARFSEHFDDAPIVEVTGRTYPVEVRYRPFGVEPGDERDQVQAVCDAVEELVGVGNGDVLVFLSGEREIHDTADALRRLQLRHTDVLPLYARLSSAEQHRIFEPHTGRRIVLSTNVAETSLTVPGVRYVVDAGSARISRYSARLKVQRLPIEAISQASADQRAGRCGRVAPGVCIRLYSANDFDDRPAFTEPEILRTNLASVILQMTAIGLGDVDAFPFVEPPDRRAVRDGYALLHELGAITEHDDGSRRLTEVGRRLARLPVDPRLGRMILEAERLGCVREVVIIAAALSIQDPRERPSDARPAADEAHRRFAGDGSDFLALVKLWDHLRERQRELSTNQFRKLCRAEYLNYLRVREWQDLFSQLRHICADLHLTLAHDPGHPDHVHQALLAGQLSHIGVRDGESREYRGAHGSKFAIAGGSAIGKLLPRWVMAAELVETNRLWARMVAPIAPEWAERAGGHLTKHSYGDPMWDERSGRAVTTERVTLFGLPVVTSRRIGYDRVDRRFAREMFIEHALVEGEWATHHRFRDANRDALADVRHLEDRYRRNDLVDHSAVFDFYDARIGADVVSGRHFDSWWRKARSTTPDLLTLRLEDLLRLHDGEHPLSDFPDEWCNGELVLPVTYRFMPGALNDGVTVHIPLSVLNRVDDRGFDWQIPAYREDLIEALLRSLPKEYRRLLTPAAETIVAVQAAMARVGMRHGCPIVEALSDTLRDTCAVDVPASAFDWRRVPDHLRITFAVHDEERVAGLDKDLGALRRALSGQLRAAIAAATPLAERSGIVDWSDLGTIPSMIETVRDGHTVRGYPTLLDTGGSVSLRNVANPELQARVMPAGIRRLLLLNASPSRKQQD
ncbi:MAG: ATP-dependent RNA helicase HrpA, partial [Acidimicrobiia bacterium]